MVSGVIQGRFMIHLIGDFSKALSFYIFKVLPILFLISIYLLF